MNSDDLIIKNVKYFLKKRGMTQKEFASKIFEGEVVEANKINNWFARKIPDEYLEKIAEIFSCSLIELKEIDFEEIDLSSKTDGFDIKILFPFVDSLESLKNEEFVNIYNIHKKLIEDNDLIKDDSKIGEEIEKILECYKMYEKLYKKYSLPEIIANMLSLITLYRLMIKTVNQDVFISQFLDNITDMSSKEYKTYVNNNYILNDKDKSLQVRKYLDDSVDEVFNLLNQLKKYPEYRDFLDYYIFILYRLDLIDSTFKNYENSLFADIYYNLLYKMGNNYIIALGNNIVKLLNKK